MIIQCAHDLMPCPIDYQMGIAEMTVENIALLGITPESIFAAYVFGFGLVLTPVLLGYAASAAIKIINKA